MWFCQANLRISKKLNNLLLLNLQYCSINNDEIRMRDKLGALRPKEAKNGSNASEWFPNTKIRKRRR